MAGLVEQLQREALNPTVPVSSLLRKVKVAAVKLKLGTIEGWVENELKGYDDEVPPYRVVVGTPKAYFPYRGWGSIGGDAKGVAALSRMPLHQSMSSLEDLVSRDKGNNLIVPYSAEIVETLNDDSDVPAIKMALHVDGSSVVAIIDAVRNLVLDWALELEKAGIVGTDVSFDTKEQARAHDPSVMITVGSIGHFTGNLGSRNVSGDISVAINVEAAKTALGAFEDALAEAPIPADILAELKPELNTIKAQLAKPKPSNTILAEAAHSVRNIIEGIVGGALTPHVLAAASALWSALGLN